MSAFTVFTYALAIGLGIVAVPVILTIAVTALTLLRTIVITLIDSITFSFRRNKHQRVFSRKKN